MYQYQKDADSVADSISKAYGKASSYIASEIDKIFRTFQTDGGLTEAEARRLLRKLPKRITLDRLSAVISRIADPQKRKRLLAVIQSPAYAYRINRFERLQRDIDEQLTQLGLMEQTVSEKHYADLADDAYYRAIFEIQKGIGFAFSFSRMSKSRVEEVLRQNWSGKLFSERIWGRTDKITQVLQEELLVQFMTGRSYRKTAQAIEEEMASGAMEARRLIRTESTYIANQSELLSYKECGIEKYRFLATLDMRTSAICAEMDGKEFEISEAEAGKNLPPLHPWCRSTTVAAIDEDAERSMRKRAARDPKTGKPYTVPADMTYSEWKKSIDEKYGAGTWEKERKKVANRSADRKQFEKYKAVLGPKGMLNTFDKFQELKYNNISAWNELKSDYRYRNRLNDKDVFVINDTVRSLPVDGRANSIADLVDENGVVKQRRIYGEDKKPFRDFDTSDHKRPKYHPMGAHKHDFDYSKDNPHGKADYLSDRDLRQNSDIIQKGVNYHDDRPKETD